MLSKSDKKPRLEPPLAVSADKAAEMFPAVRYFQIHFEFLQEQVQLILRNQEALQQQIQQLERRLSHSGHGIRIDSRKMSAMERLAAGHSAAQDSEAPGFKQTGGR